MYTNETFYSIDCNGKYNIRFIKIVSEQNIQILTTTFITEFNLRIGWFTDCHSAMCANCLYHYLFGASQLGSFQGLC